jgi:CheY-like chemotaxis protein
MMPVIDGMEATRIIREGIGTEYAKNIPIIALTANAIVGNEDMYLSKGFQAYISKPIEIKRLDAIINQWVRDEKLEKSYTGRLIAGLDMTKGFEHFGGDKETYMQVLQSFATNTRLFLESIKDVNEGNLGDYAINVHGVKGSCRGIFAWAAGNQAETLEKAAREGDISFVAANNPILIKTVSELIADIEEMLNRESAKKDKPKKDSPDKEILAKLLAACENYKIDEIEELIRQIESFEYESDDGLALWLRQNAVEMNYSWIVERLRSLSIS